MTKKTLFGRQIDLKLSGFDFVEVLDIQYEFQVLWTFFKEIRFFRLFGKGVPQQLFFQNGFFKISLEVLTQKCDARYIFVENCST